MKVYFLQRRTESKYFYLFPILCIVLFFNSAISQSAYQEIRQLPDISIAQYNLAQAQIPAADEIVEPELLIALAAPVLPVISNEEIFRVQVGAFQALVNAQSMKNHVELLGYTMVTILFHEEFYRVQVGEFNNQIDAEQFADDINKKITWRGFDGSWIVTDTHRGVKYVPLPLTITQVRPIIGIQTAQEGEIGYWIQIGAYASYENANIVKSRIEQLGYANVQITQEPGLGNITLNKIRLGPFASNVDAQRVKPDLQARLVFPGLTHDFWIFSSQLGAVGAPPVIPTLAYRVLVAKFTNSLDAALLKADLESRGRFPVFVDHIPPTYDVTVGNYPDEGGATGLLQSLRQEGFSDARIIRAGEVAQPPTVLLPEDQARITTRQETIQELIERGDFLEAIPLLEELLRTVHDNTLIIQQLQEANSRLNEEQRRLLEDERRDQAIAEDRQRRIQVLSSNALTFWEEGNADAAIAEWLKILEIDPNNAAANWYLIQARTRREALPEPQRRELEVRADIAKEQERMYTDAQRFYITGQNDTALSLYRQLIDKDPTSPHARLAQEAIIKIQSEQQAAAQLPVRASTTEWGQYLLYGGIVLVVAIVVILGGAKGFAYLKSRPKKEKLPKAAKAGNNAKTAHGVVSKMIAPAEDHSKERELTPEQMEKKKQGEEWYKKGMVEMAAKNWEDAINSFLTAASLDPNNPEPRGKVERVKMLRKEEEKLLEAQKKVIAQVDTQVTPSEQVNSPTISILKPASAPNESIPKSETTIISTTAGIVSANMSVFEQNFDTEDDNATPKGWVGEFSHASLSVQAAITPNNNGKALKFEKQNGTASTHYRTKFNKIKGKTIVEFDLRCDTKNKYFLGVYIESDEDFRKAVHTVIHTTEDNSTAALRLQGESVPYQLGSWAHIKYILNLTESTLDAYVNNQQVVQGARIPGTPEFMNTISIRDNPATTALLYLDNIRITSA